MNFFKIYKLWRHSLMSESESRRFSSDFRKFQQQEQQQQSYF